MPVPRFPPARSRRTLWVSGLSFLDCMLHPRVAIRNLIVKGVPDIFLIWVSISLGLLDAKSMFNGKLGCWGSNLSGQLGCLSNAANFCWLSTESGYTNVSSYGDSNCAVTGDGAVSCWGGGKGTLVESSTRTRVQLPSSNAIAVSVGPNHTCAVTSTGVVVCWGDNKFGQMGDATIDWTSPTPVPRLNTRIKAVSVGGYHTCVLTSTNGVMC